MKKAFALFTTLALCAMMFASALVHGKNAAAGPQTPHAPDTYIPGEVLIQFKSGASLGDTGRRQKLGRRAHQAAD